MWLDSKRKYKLIRYEPNDLVVAWVVDVKAYGEDSDQIAEPGVFTVGRLLADELRRFEIAECGEQVWQVADADSSGLEAAWTSLLDQEGNFRDDDFEAVADPVVYLYRFKLHPDFVNWRLAMMDVFCRIFDSDALISAQHHTTWLSDTEFDLLGFRPLPRTDYPAPQGYSNIDRKTCFIVRENACRVEYSIADYPGEAPSGRRDHAQWIESKGRWTDLV